MDQDQDRMIVFHRYAIHMYYGPPIAEDRAVKDRHYSYMLTLPRMLTRDQEEAILRMISLFGKDGYPDPDGLELMTPSEPVFGRAVRGVQEKWVDRL